MAYPTTYDSFPGDWTTANPSRLSGQDVDALADSMNAVQAELGLNPSGADATVVARLDAHTTKVESAAGQIASLAAAAYWPMHESATMGLNTANNGVVVFNLDPAEHEAGTQLKVSMFMRTNEIAVTAGTVFTAELRPVTTWAAQTGQGNRVTVAGTAVASVASVATPAISTSYRYLGTAVDIPGTAGDYMLGVSNSLGLPSNCIPTFSLGLWKV